MFSKQNESRPVQLPPEAHAIWTDFVAACGEDRIPISLALAAAINDWMQYGPLEYTEGTDTEAPTWRGDDGCRGEALEKVAVRLIRLRCAFLADGIDLPALPRSSDDEPIMLTLLPLVGKPVHDRFLAACQTDQLDPTMAATAALWWWLYSDALHRPAIWGDEDDASVRAQALRGCAKFALQLVAGKADDGSQEATPTPAES